MSSQMNLVPGGARPGYFQTRDNRIVLLRESFTLSESPQLGMEPVGRTCWKGDLFNSDRTTIETAGVWEASGAFQNPTGVTTKHDLIIFMRAPDTQLKAGA